MFKLVSCKPEASRELALRHPRPEKLNTYMMSLQRRREQYQIIHMRQVRMAQVPNDLNIKCHYNDRLGLAAIVPKAPQYNPMSGQFTITRTLLL